MYVIIIPEEMLINVINQVWSQLTGLMKRV